MNTGSRAPREPVVRGDMTGGNDRAHGEGVQMLVREASGLKGQAGAANAPHVARLICQGETGKRWPLC